MKSGFCDITQLLNLYDKLLLRRLESSCESIFREFRETKLKKMTGRR
ncbi:Uncharacterized protein YR821_3032 [Yersinia ruckeri]|uniref:Uncharacterized protein n=1 Tax=Yersinia ruckeri TaxID=29486 RepID=A0A0A8VH09_YERRU|nr:hypothetical protein yruck0001_3090 [Yersinia ruckeri ATCC 29473]QTD77948.1 Uncharacterized protein YR821_3032 [Yersinia ruckeri]CEK28865.1 hypothetical protein CSF007_15715 [Yersinia ruckeri]